MQQTISGKFFINLLGTLSVSYIFIYTAKVKILLNKNNPQVTNASNSLVGTSEAIRLLNINTRSIHKIGKSRPSPVPKLGGAPVGDRLRDDNLKFKE